MMSKRIRILLISTIFLMLFINIFFTPKIIGFNEVNQNDITNPKPSANLQGAENIIITYSNRRVDLGSNGLLTIRDILIVKNLNGNPISSIFIGIPLAHSMDLIFFECKGENENSLVIERPNIVMNEYEMLSIYFDSPLFPNQSKTITFTQNLKRLIKSFYVNNERYTQLTSMVFPVLPYKLEGEIKAYFFIPEVALEPTGDWGTYNPGLFALTYSFEDIRSEIGEDFIEPLLVNLDDKKEIDIWFKEAIGAENTGTKLEVEECTREIFISPWGIIKVKEEILIKNMGVISSNTISFNVTHHAKGIFVSDDLGEILGVRAVFEGSKYTTYNIDLLTNRLRMLPYTSFRFNLEYYLPFENYISFNWFQESIQIDLLTTVFNYLGTDQTINIVIDGCYTIDSITETPDAIKKSKGTTILVYKSDFVSPLENKLIQITFTVDFFNLLLRPIIFILIIAAIASIYVIIIKSRKKDREMIELTQKFIPKNEIREFCSLYEEKNALFLEIRQVKEDAKRKKIARKRYKNVLEKNTLKISEIEREVIPFKKVLLETGETFENVVKRLEILEAERISVNDSLKLLEARYKKGRLPSRAAYLKLSDDFNKRRRKIDRTIDKLIQQLRSYLL